LPCHRGEDNLVAVVVVDDDIRRANHIERDDEQREERTYPYCKKRQECQYPGYEVAVGAERVGT
jgi:hypothetical protein